MALYTDAAMILFYDFAGPLADHDDWHTYEHMHERLSIPGFERGTRWIATAGGPAYMIIYEVAGVDTATSPAYLARLNAPTAWTQSVMPRFRGMVRGFCTVAASAGFGLGRATSAIRFDVPESGEAEVLGDLDATLADVSARRGMAGAHVLRPTAPPPMTREQSLRGRDAAMSWLALVTGYDAQTVRASTRAVSQALEHRQASVLGAPAIYDLHYSLTAREASRSAARPGVSWQGREAGGH